MRIRTPGLFGRLLAVTTAALLLAPLGPAVGSAAAATVTAATAAAEDDPPRIETILDVSGSMAASDIGGGTRMEAAKDAMYTLVDGTPSSIEMGVRLYGSEYPGKSKATGCKDTKLISPVAAMDAGAKSAVKKKIAATKPTGFTPIGHSLRTAVKDLGTEGKRRIILVSDGEDTCAPPEPCEIAKELAGAGVDLAVDTLGFKVKGKAAEQLKCIARVTKGTYRSAEDATELSAGLQGALKQGIKGYNATGTPIKGGKDCASAPYLKPGQYVDRLRYSERSWYRMSARPGQAVRFSATWISDSPSVGMSADMTTKSEVEGKKYATVTSSYSGIGKGGGFRTTGEQSDRLTFQHVPSGRSTVPICANVRTYAGSKGSASPVEIKYSLVGRPVTRADLKADPSALSSPGGKEAIDDGPSEAPAKQSGSGSDGGTADRAERAESAGSSTELASPLVLGGTLALALLAGIAARLLTNRRRTR